LRHLKRIRLNSTSLYIKSESPETDVSAGNSLGQKEINSNNANGQKMKILGDDQSSKRKRYSTRSHNKRAIMWDSLRERIKVELQTKSNTSQLKNLSLGSPIICKVF
jgi:hypothetical protein